MTNPTREEVKEWSEEECGCTRMCLCRVFEAYLRALDMRDEIAQILESEIGPWYKPKEMKWAIQHFDGGSDEN